MIKLTAFLNYIYCIYLVHYPQLKVFADLEIGRCNYIQSYFSFVRIVLYAMLYINCKKKPIDCARNRRLINIVNEFLFFLS